MVREWYFVSIGQQQVVAISLMTVKMTASTSQDQIFIRIVQEESVGAIKTVGAASNHQQEPSDSKR